MRERRGGLAALAGLVVACLLVCETAHAARLPSANRECAACHVAWITDFKRDDVTTLIPYEPKAKTESGQQDSSSTDRMCFSCHDGFVLDSRFLWKDSGHGHPLGQKP
jgi:hypothetical protein